MIPVMNTLIIFFKILLNPFIEKMYYENIISETISYKTLDNEPYSPLKILRKNIPNVSQHSIQINKINNQGIELENTFKNPNQKRNKENYFQKEKQANDPILIEGKYLITQGNVETNKKKETKAKDINENNSKVDLKNKISQKSFNFEKNLKSDLPITSEDSDR